MDGSKHERILEMRKIKLKTNYFSYPMPVTLVGTFVGDRVDFTAVAWMSSVNYRPPMLAVAINKKHYSPEGIRETRTFSVNIPSVDLLTQTDYCGIVSGRNTDKSEVFELFFGELKTAPMIEGCPICVECKLIDVYDRLPTNYLFIGEIVAVYSEEKYLTDGKPDISKMHPLILTVPQNKYWVIGKQVGNAWKDGLKLKE
jgi:flavin reductase (DIM6/NTAB) family NADH-FMN oxidoreductase RutF